GGAMTAPSPPARNARTRDRHGRQRAGRGPDVAPGPGGVAPAADDPALPGHGATAAAEPALAEGGSGAGERTKHPMTDPTPNGAVLNVSQAVIDILIATGA